MGNRVWNVRRIVTYLLGLFVMALGVSVSKSSDLGVSPVNSIPAVVSDILKIDMGICTTAVFIGFIFVQLFILRRDFKMFCWIQIVGSAIFGGFVSITNLLCGKVLPACDNYGMQLLYVCISVVLVAAGILLYLHANILSLPGEGVMQALSSKTGIRLSTAKLCFDWTVVAIAAILSLVFMGRLSSIREGTILAAIGVGVCLRFLTQAFAARLRAFLKNEEAAEAENAAA